MRTRNCWVMSNYCTIFSLRQRLRKSWSWMAFEPMSFSILVWCSATMNTANVKLLSWDIFGGKSVYDIFSPKTCLQGEPKNFFCRCERLVNKKFLPRKKLFSDKLFFLRGWVDFFSGSRLFWNVLNFFETRSYDYKWMVVFGFRAGRDQTMIYF